jgi:subtilase family serine protease
VPPLPDLQVPLVQGPEEGFTGQPMQLNWRVENRGTGNTPVNQAPWVDGIYLSQDQTFNPQTDRFVGSREHTGGLAQNASYTASNISVNIPNDIAGDWFVFVAADSQNSVYEFTGESNNAGFDQRHPIHIHATPPDLIVASASAPPNGTANRQITVNWTVQNQGAFDANPNWIDTIYLSADATLDPMTDTALASVPRTSILGPGLSYNSSTAVKLPACISGNYFLFVFTDSGKQVFEYDPSIDAENNNFSQAHAIQIALTPPDLQVTGVSNALSGVAGQPFTLEWTVANQGVGPTVEDSWVDRVYLSPSPTFNQATALLAASFTHDGDLQPNASYTRTESVVIPTTAQGIYYVLISTDASGAVSECSGEGNNIGSGTTTLNVTNSLPDLVVSSVTAPADAFAGQTITAEWSVNNAGTAGASASAIKDFVYFSPDSTLDQSDKFLGAGVSSGPLAVGASYSAQAQVMLPNVPAGTYYLIVRSDSDNFIFEGQHEDNNTNYAVVAILIPDVDLQAQSVSVPANAFSGQAMPVSWTVINAGSRQTFASDWTDYVLLSHDQILDPTDQRIGFKAHTGALVGGASYSETLNVDVPQGLSGQYYIFIRLDFHNHLAEADEANNIVGPNSVALELPPPVDLTVASVNAPATGSPGEIANIQWTTQNIGSNTATGNWTDAVYLSIDNTWDIDDAPIGRVDHSGPLAPGASYAGALNAMLPAVNPGAYYVIVRTDVRNRVREIDDSNNATASSSSMNVDVTELALGVPHNSTLQTGQERFYKTNAPANETLLYTLDAQQNDGATEMFVRQGAMSSRSVFDFLHSRPGEADQEIVVPNTFGDWYYNLTRGDHLPNGPTPFTIKAEIIPFSIRSVSPNKGGNTGQVTVRLEGAKYDQFTEVELIRGERRVKPVWMELASQNRIHATFDLAGLPPGSYDVRAWSEQIIWDVNPTTGEIFERKEVYGDNLLANGFEVVTGGGPIKRAQLLLPSSARIGNRFSFLLEVANEGNTDMPGPVLLVFSPNGTPLSTSPDVSDGSGYQEQIVVLGERRRTVLAPGERVIVNFYAKAIKEPSSNFVLQDLATSTLPLDWNALEPNYRDSSSDTEWNMTWTNFRGIVGNTWNQLHQVMRKLADDKAIGTSDRFFTGNQLINDLVARARSGQNDPNDFRSGSSNREYAPDSSKSGSEHLSNVSRQALSSCENQQDCTSDPEENEYCEPIQDRAKLTETELRFRFGYLGPDPINIGLPHLRKVYGDQVGDLYELFVDYGDYNNGHPRDEKAFRYYSDGDEIVERGNLVGVIPRPKGFRKSGVIQDHMLSMIRAIAEAVRQECPNLPDNASVSMSLQELIPCELTPRKLNCELAFKGSPRDIPGLIAGGVGLGPEQNPPDSRSVTGTVLLTKHVNRCGKFLYLEIEPTFTYTIKDTLDFCPGNPGKFLAKILTIPLSKLEASKEANDVVINVTFTESTRPITLFRNSLGNHWCDNEIACPIQPPSSPCALPCSDCSDGPAPPPPPGCPGGDAVPTVVPRDPNDKIGPTGFGPQVFVGLQQSLPYTINFENVSSASAAAQRIRITDQLDPNLDWRTFRLKEIGFGAYHVTVPENRAFYQTRLQLGPDLGNLLADITARVDIATGQVTWTLTAIDPNTGEQPHGALQGLLLPNDSTGRGQGFVTYTVKAKTTAPTGAQINNNAIITFDTEEPIITNMVANTLDADAPTSAVTALPANSEPTFTVSWSGNDANGGSGLLSYDIWMAENDGPYQPFLSGTTDTSTSFTGQLGRTYRFYSIAHDNAGNVESVPATADATTTIVQPQNPVPVITKLDPDSTVAGNTGFTLKVSGNSFITTSTVQWNGTPRATTFVSATELSAVITANDVAVAGTASVNVLNPAPGGGLSNLLPFTINSPPTYTISGQVTVGSNGLGGVTMSLSGSQSATAQTDAGGSYSFANLPTGSYTVTPSKISYTFNPPNLTFNGLSNNQTATFIAVQTPQFPILISEETSTRAIALDSVLWFREPFRLDSPVPLGVDTRTRVMLLAMNFDLQPGEDISVVTADAEDASHRIYPLTVEHVDKVPGFDWLSCVIVRLNDDMGDIGDVLVRITVRGVSSNRVRMGIGHIGGGPPDDLGAVPTPGRQP